MLTVSFSDGTIVDIEDGLLTTFQSFEQQQMWSKEAGGILIGKKLMDEEHYVLSAVSTPTKQDKRTRFSFTRSKQSAQQYIDKHWIESGGIENYFGEWHTHPEIKPSPSNVDQSLIRQIVSDKSSPFSKVLLIIVGQKGTLYLGLADSQGTGAISITQEIEVDYEHLRIKE